MKKKRLYIDKNIIQIGLLCILFLLLQVVIQKASVMPALRTFNGVFSALQYGVCLLVLYVARRHGGKIAIALMSVSILAMINGLIHGTKTVLPGLANAIFYVITIAIIAQNDAKREWVSKVDSVTSVYNRKGLYLEIQEKINRKIEFSIIYISLNNFKEINDTYGHAYGDELLRKVSKRINENIGEGCVVARIGGSEFVVAVEKSQDVQTVADGLLEALREKTTLIVEENVVDWYSDGFAGVSRFPIDTSDYESLIKYADIAMTESRAQKSKSALLFNNAMLDSINRQVYVRNLIKGGLDKDLFYLVYQPQFELNQKKLRGFETLIRLKNDSGENVSPGEFIPIAERSDLILQIDDYVLARAMKEFKEIVVKNPSITISINVSAKNFAEKDFVGKVQKYLDQTGFPANNLEIEITEYCMVNSMEITMENINVLRKLGVQIALDDFGTGYSALNYVASLNFDLLKIDKSLIDDIENDKKRRDFVRAIITMGQLMECEIISEGVENDGQINCLKQDGCDFVQGFVWGKPLMYEDAVKLALK